MTVQEAITKVAGIISNPKVENGGVTTEGRYSAEECNAIVTVLNSLLTIDGHTNVDKADGLVLNDYVLVKKAYSSTWEARTLASVRQAVDNTVRQGSANPVSSNAVYVKVQELLTAIDDCASADELTTAVTEMQGRIDELANRVERVIDGGSARTLRLNLAARRIDCGKASGRES